MHSESSGTRFRSLSLVFNRFLSQTYIHMNTHTYIRSELDKPMYLHTTALTHRVKLNSSSSANDIYCNLTLLPSFSYLRTIPRLYIVLLPPFLILCLSLTLIFFLFFIVLLWVPGEYVSYLISARLIKKSAKERRKKN